MKSLTILILCFLSLSVYGQEKFDGHTWEAPYDLPVPVGWTIERFSIPINFAPQIAYKGVEDIRFMPGWGNSKSDGYWTYAFLWYLDNSPVIDEKIIAENLKIYYTGLIRSNTDSVRAITEKTIPVTASFKKIPAEGVALETYLGSIQMMDYMQHKPIVLNCFAHLKKCSGKTILFYQVSPKPLRHANWFELYKLWSTFKCEK